MTRSLDLLSLVIPVYRNEESLGDLLGVIDGLNLAFDGAFEAVFVVDGSPDRCYERLHDELPRRAWRSKLVLLSRNFGSFAAVRAGLGVAAGPRFAVMAADLQEPPELVQRMNRALLADEADVVVGVRQARSDPWASRFMSGLFWRLYRRYVVPEVPSGGVDVFACNQAFRDQLLKLDERHSSLIAQIFWLGFRRSFVAYERQPRRHGSSAWSWRRKVDYLMDSVFSFTDLPIRLLLRGGAAVAAAAALFGAFVAASRVLGMIEVPGYTATIIAIVFFGALNLFALGVVGSYAWRAYENTKGRPLHVVLRRHDFSKSDADGR